MKLRLATTLLSSAAALLAAQTASAQLFWTANAGSDIVRANLDGTGVTTIFQRADNPDFTGNAIGVAATTSHVYWTENLGGGGGIWRANHDGSDSQRIVSGTFSGGLQFVSIANNQLWFSDWNDGLFSAPLAGGSATQISNPGASTTPDASNRNTGVALMGPNQLLSVAANTNDRNLYISDVAGGTFSVLGLYSTQASGHHTSYGLVYRDSSNTIINGIHGNHLLAFYDVAGGTVTNASVQRPLGLALSPDQNQVYVVSQFHGTQQPNPGIYVYDFGAGSVSPLLTWSAVEAQTPTFGVAVIPEPGTYALIFGIGIGAFLLIRRRFRK
jgi:hypothetical protein